jgi:dTDP-4-dehydrorhamnose 3,5-epimerase
MSSEQTRITGAWLLTPGVHEDARGSFRETYRAEALAALGLPTHFVQDNVSESSRGVLRGLHNADGMAKLTQVVHGETYHVIADLRPDSPTYRTWQAFEFSSRRPALLYVPPGVANGFCVVSAHAAVHYKQTRYYDPAAERRVRWNDPTLGVIWPITNPQLSDQDRDAPGFEPAP